MNSIVGGTFSRFDNGLLTMDLLVFLRPTLVLSAEHDSREVPSKARGAGARDARVTCDLGKGG